MTGPRPAIATVELDAADASAAADAIRYALGAGAAYAPWMHDDPLDRAAAEDLRLRLAVVAALLDLRAAQAVRGVRP